MTISPLPAVPSISNPDTFDADTDAFLGALPTFREEANALAAGMNAAAAGTPFAMAYAFDDTTSGDPGPGFLRLNNATQNAATVVYIDLVDGGGVTQTNALDTMDDSTSTVKGFLKIAKASAPENFILFAIASMASPAGYRSFTGTVVIATSTNPFADGDDLVFSFTRTGDKGDTGTTSIGGITGLGTGVATLLAGNSSGTGGPLGSTAPTISGLLTVNGTTARHEFSVTSSNTEVIRLRSTASSNPYGASIEFTGAAPNDSTRHFLACMDTGATRAVIRSNGGIANFTANDANLSDIGVKPEFVLLSQDDLDQLEAAFIAVDWAKYKYADQGHNDWNYGYSAQGVARAFAQANPAITDVWNPTTRVQTGVRRTKVGEERVQVGKHEGQPVFTAKDLFENVPVYEEVETPPEKQLLSVYHNDLKEIGGALLARALVRIAALERKLAEMEARERG